ncbi:MAG: hypothetical protein AVDCRST_MAG50-2333 [uncultured Acidimicrobiales bacterium]|uniref:PIG-L family deacetylase n=1 Tax=uncultured Acidimicrobiales bacterium TaxID=310071 RepID=A0A6J4IHM8_9ACTN|nr:MAG: hypothetical protein AVDCRST_MAG50-2333 [uncultured Acidimicrobiales bacterium]
MTVVRDVPARALAVYAHPDDADVSCGGTLAAWARAGSVVHVVICASGDKGSLDPATDPVALADVRAQEAAAAAGVLGLAGHHLLGRPDGEVDNDLRLRRDLVAVIRSVRPEIVVCPDPSALFFGSSYVNHRDHREVGWAAVDAVAPAAWSPLYFPDAGPPHRAREIWLSGTFEPDVWVDISGTIDVKARALQCHVSQLGEAGEHLRTIVQQRAAEAGAEAGVSGAEGFRRITPAG